MPDIHAVLGVAAALTGSVLTAMPNPRLARIGFACFFISNIPLLWHAIQIDDAGFTLLYGAYTATSVTGIFFRTGRGRTFLLRVGGKALLEPSERQDAAPGTGTVTR